MFSTVERTIKIGDEESFCLILSESFENETVTLHVEGAGEGNIVIPKEVLPLVMSALKRLSKEHPVKPLSVTQ